MNPLLASLDTSITATNTPTPRTIAFSLATARQSPFVQFCDVGTDGTSGFSPKITNVQLKLVCTGTQVKIVLRD